MSNFHVIVPARMASERLPGKPLLLIQGIPMVVRVAKVCISVFGKENVTVSTPDTEIIDACDQYGIQSTLSSIKCKSGTDRVFEYAQSTSFRYYFNVQGDEPLLKKNVLKSFFHQSAEVHKSSVGVTEIIDASLVESESVVKVALSENRLVYASRKPLPIATNEMERHYFKHTGLYCFTREDVMVFGETPPGPLELAENVEILRLIERGKSINAISVESYGRSVDTERDFLFVNRYGKFED